jgi:hypothetical protein
MTSNEDKTIKIAWQPLEGSQALAVGCPCDEILYHGTRGPGKTEGQEGYFVGRCGIGYGSHWRGVIFDRSYKNLDDIVAKSREMIPKVFPKAKFLSAKSDYKWVFPGGEELLFRHIKRKQDYYDYHGHEYPYIGWNELTKFPTSELYDLMGSCNRSSFVPELHSPELTDKDRRIIEECNALGEEIPLEVIGRLLPDIPLVTFSTTNPHGPGHNWVKRRWIDKAPPGVPMRFSTKVFNPRTQQKEVVTRTRVHIFGSYKENKFLDAKYVAFLNGIKDPNKRRAWLGGDWSITSGGALDDIWKPQNHILPRFIVPKNWRLTRSFDWGSSHPFSVGFWAVANGEEVRLPNGKVFCPAKGSLIRFAEVYGVEHAKDELGVMRPAYGTNKGVRASAREVARRINEAVEELTEDGWIESAVTEGPADGQIFNVNEKESLTIAALMEKEGVKWYAADKSAGTRKMGLEIIRGALENSNQGEGPGIYVMGNCEAFIETVPGLPRDEDDPDDIDTTAEDHCFIAGTKIQTESGPRNIEDIHPGEMVWTREGLRPVVTNHETPSQEVFEVNTTKTQLVGTGNHPVFVENEFKRIDSLTKGDTITTWSKLLATQYRNSGEKVSTFAGSTSNGKGEDCTAKFGHSSINQKSRRASTSTTKTVISQITNLAILNLLANMNTCQNTKATRRKNKLKRGAKTKKRQWLATKQCRRKNATKLQRKRGRTAGRNHQRKGLVNIAARNTKHTTPKFQSSVTPIVKQTHCITDVKKAGVETVYNLTVADCHEYFANGILVHNCYDETRYMLLDNKPTFAGSVSVGVAS